MCVVLAATVGLTAPGAAAFSAPAADTDPQADRLAVPSAETGAASVATATRATLHGAVTPSGSTVAYAFEYGPTPAYGQTTPEVQLRGDAPKTSVKAVLTGLSGGVTYHYRLVAKSAEGTDLGAGRTFSTTATPRPPSASTLPAAPIGSDRATLVARVNASGLPTSYHFEWGPTKGYGQSTPLGDAGAGGAPTTVSTELTGLQVGATYHYRVVATNSAGVHRGGDRSFSTSRGLTGITLVPAAETIPWDGALFLNGAVAGRSVGGVQVVLFRQDFPFTGAYRRATAIRTGADGRYSLRLSRVFVSTRVKVQAGTSSRIASPPVTIGSQVYVKVRVERRRSRSVRLSGRVYPARPSGRARIERLSASGDWVKVRTVKLQRRARGRSGFRVTVKRMRQVAAYRAVVEPRDGGAHVDSPSTPVDIAGRR